MSQAWEYDGIDLTRHGYNVRLLGAPFNTPSRRSDNLVIPQKSGMVYVRKALDQRIVSLAMWVKNIPASGGAESEADMLANLDVLRGLFARPGQHELKHQFGNVTRTVQAEVVNSVEFQPQGKLNVYYLTAEFLLADPLWRAQNPTTVGPTNLTTNPQSIGVTNGGSYQVEDAVITLTGEIVDPKLTVGSIWVKYTGVVPAGQSLVIDCSDWTASLNSVDVSGDISHEGDLIWLIFQPGVNTLAVTCTSVTGATIKVQFTAPYV